MTRSNMTYGGAVVFWTLCENFLRSVLEARWGAAGHGDKVPDVRPKVAILKDALEEVLGGPRVLVRPLSSRTGWTVVTENRGQDGNAYQNELVARVCPTTGAVLFDRPDDETTGKVLGAYSANLHRLQAGQVSNAMVRVLQSLGGIRLRPSGGIYWLPGERLDEWQAVAQAVEAAADRGAASCYVMTHELKPEHVRAVRDALVHEVQTESRRLNEEILSGDLGPKAIQTRRDELAALQQKVRDYEEILGVAIDTLEQVADANDQSAAFADLFAAASAEAAAFSNGFAGSTH